MSPHPQLIWGNPYREIQRSSSSNYVSKVDDGALYKKKRIGIAYNMNNIVTLFDMKKKKKKVY